MYEVLTSYLACYLVSGGWTPGHRLRAGPLRYRTVEC